MICKDCKHDDIPYHKYPCKVCKEHAFKVKFEPKEPEEKKK